MIDLFLWFVYKDSRADIRLLRNHPSLVLLANYAVSVGLAVTFFVLVNYDSIFENNISKFIFVKMIWELVHVIFFAPYLVHKSLQTHVFKSRTGVETHDIGLYLKSRV